MTDAFRRVARNLTYMASLIAMTGSAVQAQMPANAPASGSAASATSSTIDTLAAQFGSLPALNDISLSPDGTQIAFIATSATLRRSLFVVSTRDGDTPRGILHSSGDPDYLEWCQWATDSRLVCMATVRDRVAGQALTANSIFALDADGSNAVRLSSRQSMNALWVDLRGGSVTDWLPDEPGSILMTRSYVPEQATGTLLAQSGEGLGVDRIDITNGRARHVSPPRRDAISYLTDGRGNLRLMAVQPLDGTGQMSPVVRYLYRGTDGGNWQALTSYNVNTEEGMMPVAVDAASNSAFGFAKINGRAALVATALDGSGTTRNVYAHPEVDVDSVIRIGRSRRIVGASYATDRRHAVMTDTAIATMTNALKRALGGRDVYVVDASLDESRYLIWAGSDVQPGSYFLFTPATRQLRPLLAERPQLESLTLSPMRAVQYPAADGTMIPAYLTLPPGKTDARGLPAIVMPHGGPSARDEWGFDWMTQYFAQLGFAVLQPNYRGSSGYGDAWYQRNGFQSWQTAIGDITDGARWLMAAQGADPQKMAIVGWSYGGYAALQSAATSPDIFKSVVAIAPVTDLAQLKQEAEGFTNARIQRDFIGSGPHVREGSPAQQASRITAPVLMFHGDLDQNVNIAQSRTMERALRSQGKTVELITYPQLEHSLESTTARTDMLRRIGHFLRR